jgi:two-component system, NarL family, sensor histidine kinase UhpB
LTNRYRTLRAWYLGGVILPLLLVIAGLIAAGFLAYRQVDAMLGLEHGSQATTLSALPVSEMYGGALLGLAVMLVAALLSLRALQRVTGPIQALADQTGHLARGENVEPLPASGIIELDALEESFTRMATEMTTYRSGLRRYVGAITQSQEEERRRIARELHDETIQSLVAINRRLELYQSTVADPDGRARLTDIQGLIDGVVRGIRLISQDLRPPVLEDLGLIPALQNLVNGAQSASQPPSFKIALDVQGQSAQLSADEELALYRITQEALNNVRKHASATQVWVTLSFAANVVDLDVRDNGTGFDVPMTLAELAQGGSFGLMGIQERVWAVGGLLTIHSQRGQGATLHISVPLRAPAMAAVFGP